jgi:hypothetical protein
VPDEQLIEGAEENVFVGLAVGQVRERQHKFKISKAFQWICGGYSRGMWVGYVDDMWVVCGRYVEGLRYVAGMGWVHQGSAMTTSSVRSHSTSYRENIQNAIM